MEAAGDAYVVDAGWRSAVAACYWTGRRNRKKNLMMASRKEEPLQSLIFGKAGVHRRRDREPPGQCGGPPQCCARPSTFSDPANFCQRRWIVQRRSLSDSPAIPITLPAGSDHWSASARNRNRLVPESVGRPQSVGHGRLHAPYCFRRRQTREGSARPHLKLSTSIRSASGGSSR